MKEDKKRALELFHRERILQAAEALFAENGAAGTTMDEIARAAGYSKATLYAYFLNKEEIRSGLIFKGMRLLEKAVREAAKTPEGWIKRYYSICGAVAAFFRENGVAFEMTASAINVDLENPETPQVFREIYRVGERLNREIVDFLRLGVWEGLVREDRADVQTVMLLWAGLSGILRLTQQKGDYLNRELDTAEETFLQSGYRFLLDGILQREGSGKNEGIGGSREPAEKRQARRDAGSGGEGGGTGRASGGTRVDL